MIAALHRAAALIALSLLAAGCANFSAISPGESALTVEARVGPPGTVWKNADGSEAWEYPMGPSGVQTFMIDIGPDRAVRAVRQVLREARKADRAEAVELCHSSYRAGSEDDRESMALRALH